MASWPTTEQEEKLEALFTNLSKVFKKLKKASNPDKIHGMLKEITAGLKEGKALIKEFEFEARADGMPAPILAERKRDLVNQINGFIAMKKEVSTAQAGRNELITGAATQQDEDLKSMSMVRLIKKGHQEIDEIDSGLNRAERVALDTVDVGTQAASALNHQTEKLNQIVDDLHEMEFTMKKATKVLRDITRGLLTDKCIAFLLFLVAAGVVAIIVVKIVNPNKNQIVAAACNITSCEAAVNWTENLINSGLNSASNGLNSAANSANSATGLTTGRRMLGEKFLRAAWALANGTHHSIKNHTSQGLS